jgi:hypothetical protein
MILAAYRQDDWLHSILKDPRGALAELSDKDQRRLDGLLVNAPPRATALLARAIDVLRRLRFDLPHKHLRRVTDLLQSSNTDAWHDSDFF